jgi:transposase InsO family protein
MVHVGAPHQQITQREKPPPGLIHHSDRGSQYASHEYRKALENSGLTASMSRKADCWDNAPMERFFGTLKTELVNGRRYATREEAKRDLFATIEGYDNRRRLHSSFDTITPEQAEHRAA